MPKTHHKRRSLAATILIPSAFMLLGSCAPTRPIETPVQPAHSDSLSRATVAPAINKAIGYLDNTQLKTNEVSSKSKLYPGDWPQKFSIKPGLIRLSFMWSNPFYATFVHHTLAHVTPANATRLGVAQKQLAQARATRLRAIGLMHRFSEPLESSSTGAYGYGARPNGQPGRINKLIARLMVRKLKIPLLKGPLAPPNVAYYPKEFMIWPDADDTAVVYVALQEHADLERKPEVAFPCGLFAKWRDLPGMQRQMQPGSLLEVNSGVFLTWFSDPGLNVPNDADIVVNANVLFAMARFDRRKTPGYRQAVTWINRAVRQKDPGEYHQLSPYYGNTRIFHYAVSRAYREGPVPELKPAVMKLVQELTQSARYADDGGIYWPSEDTVLSTACALLTFLNTDTTCSHESEKLIDGAVRYLLDRQHAGGGWRADWACFASSDSGTKLYFKSDAWTTALALEALCRYQLRP
ncbi:MAG: hypothetical protein HKP20_01295 [Akkermansiaceae bacterium]|nr:hypothetical protein [Akkermansiaceae bacterium]